MSNIKIRQTFGVSNDTKTIGYVGIIMKTQSNMVIFTIIFASKCEERFQFK